MHSTRMWMKWRLSIIKAASTVILKEEDNYIICESRQLLPACEERQYKKPHSYANIRAAAEATTHCDLLKGNLSDIKLSCYRRVKSHYSENKSPVMRSVRRARCSHLIRKCFNRSSGEPTYVSLTVIALDYNTTLNCVGYTSIYEHKFCSVLYTWTYPRNI